MKFPVTIRHRDGKAKIYAPAKGFKYYRVSYRIAGKRRMETFETYSAAKAVAKKKAKEMAKGSHAVILTARQSLDALAAIEKLNKYRIDTGRHMTLLGAVSDFVEMATKLPEGHTPMGAIDGYLGKVVNVKRIDISEGVAEFVLANVPRTKATNGERAQLSSKYAYNRKLQLEKFAKMFPGTAVCDLTRVLLDQFIHSLAKLDTKSRNKRKATSAKSRNHYRAAIRQFLEWSVRRDYLAKDHRLFEADTMRAEHANTADVQFYTPLEFAALLEVKDEELRPLVAIGELAGLRTAELLRLDWKDVWRVPGRIEVTAGKSKTRQRRLVEICDSLAAWLKGRARRQRRVLTRHDQMAASGARDGVRPMNISRFN